MRRLGPGDADVVHALADGDAHTALLRARGVVKGWVLTDVANEPANRLYASAGGEAREVVEWDFPCAER